MKNKIPSERTIQRIIKKSTTPIAIPDEHRDEVLLTLWNDLLRLIAKLESTNYNLGNLIKILSIKEDFYWETDSKINEYAIYCFTECKKAIESTLKIAKKLDRKLKTNFYEDKNLLQETKDTLVLISNTFKYHDSVVEKNTELLNEGFGCIDYINSYIDSGFTYIKNIEHDPYYLKRHYQMIDQIFNEDYDRLFPFIAISNNSATKENRHEIF